MSDILFDNLVFDRLREIGDQSHRICELESEIARLRLTAEERELLENAASQHDSAGTDSGDNVARVLRGLLERTK